MRHVDVSRDLSHASHVSIKFKSDRKKGEEKSNLV